MTTRTSDSNKMKKILFAIITAVSLVSLASCDEAASTAGGSLIPDQVEIVRDSVYTIDGLPLATGAVRSRTILQLLGRYSAKGYGEFESDIVCQYMPSAEIDTLDVNASDIDSVKLCLTVYQNGFAGDSTIPMGLSVHPLVKQLPTALYSDFDPAGYYDPASIGSTTYSGIIDGYPYIGKDTEGTIFKNIYVKLPTQFGVDLFNKFKTDPSVFNSPQAFAQWFPGLYIRNTFGSGRVTRIANNSIDVYYRSTFKIGEGENLRDTTLYLRATYLGVTPEVLTNNNIRFNIADELKQRAESGENIIVGPVGYDVEFTFPAREILAKYKAQSGPLAVVNSLSLRIPAVDIANDYGLAPPTYILLIKKSKREEFFAKNNINDDISSFYATYNSTTKSYTFASMRGYIEEIIRKGSVDPEDEEFVICPVNISFYTNNANYYYGTTASTTVSSITPYVTEPVLTKLDLDKAHIEFSFSKQTL